MNTQSHTAGPLPNPPTRRGQADGEKDCQRRPRSLSGVYIHVTPDYDGAIIHNRRMAKRLPPMEANFVFALMCNRFVNAEILYDTVWGCPANGGPMDLVKSINQYAWRIRRKIRPLGLDLVSYSGSVYSLALSPEEAEEMNRDIQADRKAGLQKSGRRGATAQDYDPRWTTFKGMKVE